MAVSPQQAAGPSGGLAEFEKLESRAARIGKLRVRRALPARGRQTVGAWCFADHFGPQSFFTERGLSVAPHPHIGLQTVTWLFDGEMLHRDSLGSEQLIRPGELNLMTAGIGVVHSEENPGRSVGKLHGIQLWVAQPDATRFGEARFSHHGNLPKVELSSGVATVIVGEFGGHEPTQADASIVGLELSLRPGVTTIPVAPSFEYALIVIEGDLTAASAHLEPGCLAYLGAGADEIVVTASGRTTAMLIGGAPIEAPLLMWWNFVARSRDEVEQAWRDWIGGSLRFPHVNSALPRIEVGPPPWLQSEH